MNSPKLVTNRHCMCADELFNVPIDCYYLHINSCSYAANHEIYQVQVINNNGSFSDKVFNSYVNTGLKKPLWCYFLI